MNYVVDLTPEQLAELVNAAIDWREDHDGASERLIRAVDDITRVKGSIH